MHGVLTDFQDAPAYQRTHRDEHNRAIRGMPRSTPSFVRKRSTARDTDAVAVCPQSKKCYLLAAGGTFSSRAPEVGKASQTQLRANSSSQKLASGPSSSNIYSSPGTSGIRENRQGSDPLLQL